MSEPIIPVTEDTADNTEFWEWAETWDDED